MTQITEEAAWAAVHKAERFNGKLVIAICDDGSYGIEVAVVYAGVEKIAVTFETLGSALGFLIDELQCRRCELCGCTEEYACEGGCGWQNTPPFAPDRCTACEPYSELQRRIDEEQYGPEAGR